MSYFVYILQSCKNNKYYIGQTKDLEQRVEYHNSGYSKSTKSGVPWKLVFLKEFHTRSEAMKYELKLKKSKSKKYLEHLIQIQKENL